MTRALAILLLLLCGCAGLPKTQPPAQKLVTLQNSQMVILPDGPRDYIFPPAVPIATNTLTFDCAADWPDQIWIESSPDLIHWQLYATLNNTNALTVLDYGGNQFFRIHQ